MCGSEIFNNLTPDIIVILGDRYEAFSAAFAALSAKIPIAHIHGGESTAGLIDDPIRHAITKMSSIHFVATKKSYYRIIQLGENKKNIHFVGSLGIDKIIKAKLYNKSTLTNKYNISFKKKIALVTFHPVTLEENTKKDFDEILKALSDNKKLFIIFTFPNADADGRIIIKMIKKFLLQNENSTSYVSMGQTLFYSCLKI